MASTLTANFGWIKPQVGGDTSTWGVELNNDLDGIDTTMFEVAEAIEGISTVLVAPNEIVLNTPTGPAVNQIYGQAAGAMRWGMFLGDGEAETGGNAGANFLIQAYGDAGGFLSNPFEINRASGQVIIGAGGLAVGGAVTIGTTLNVGGAMGATGGANAAQYLVNGSATVLGNSVLQFASGWSINCSGSIAFIGAGVELAEMDAGGAFGITGQGYKPGGGSWANSSDARIKTVERPYALGLDEIMKLEPVVYRFKGNDAEPGKKSKLERVRGKPFVGLVAQDVEAVFPGMVTKRAGYVDGKAVDDLRDLDASELVYALVNAVKTLAARVQELEAR
jgi:hypothetical protein